MKNYFGSENGYSLIELIFVITIVGLLLPALIVLMGQMSLHHATTEITLEAVHLADSKMEEILAFKREHSSWNTTISSYAGEEVLTRGFTRNVNVANYPSWGSYNIDVYEINVTIAHSLLENDYNATLMLVNY